jgi:RimJ/RimL family protein N-acetyltransferase
MLRGRFVLLRPLSLADADEMRALVASGPRDTFQWTTVPTPETVEQYISTAVTATERGEALAFATCRATGELIGSTRFFDFQRWKGPKLDACEIGHTWLAQAAQRTPVNTEAKLLMLQHAFEAWGCVRVTLKTDERNARSRAAIERIGGKLDGILRAHQLGSDGKPRNTAYFTILASEWPGVKERLLSKLQGK